jgi:hypothetical protein
MKKYLVILILIIPFIFISAPIIQSGERSRVNLRPYYKELSVPQVHEIPNVAIRKKEKWGFHGHSTIDHDYYLKTINDDKVVIDHATDLMWDQSGSDKYVSWKGAKKWIENLSKKGFAGFHDWRLPTVEEAASLLDSDKKNSNLHIDPVFDKKQWGIWTCDSHISDDSLSLNGAWRVSFSDGTVSWSSNSIDIFYIRPVRLNK